MKKIAKLGAAIGAAVLLVTALPGCVAYVPDPGPQRHYRDRGDRDYDRDGVPNRYDSRPNNPNRY